MSASCHHHSSAVFSARGEIGFRSTGNSVIHNCFVYKVRYSLITPGPKVSSCPSQVDVATPDFLVVDIKASQNVRVKIPNVYTFFYRAV